MTNGEGLTLVRSDIMEEAGVGTKQNNSRVRVTKGNLEERGSQEDSTRHY